MIQKKISKYISIRMGLAMSCMMSFVGSLLGNLSSGHFSVPGWLISFAVSLVITSILAVGIGFIVPMKKVNDGLEAKFNLQKGSKKQQVIESLVSDLIYTPIISLVMVLVSVSLFALPNATKGYEAEYNGTMAQLEAVQQQINSPAEGADIGALKAQAAQLEGKLQGMEHSRPTFGKLFARSFFTGLLLEFAIAFVLIMIIEPKIQRKAFEKYIPNFTADMDMPEEI